MKNQNGISLIILLIIIFLVLALAGVGVLIYLKNNYSSSETLGLGEKTRVSKEKEVEEEEEEKEENNKKDEDSDPNVIFDKCLVTLDYFSCGLAGVKKNDKFGYIDKNGKVVVDFKYSNIENFKDNCARVIGDTYHVLIKTDDGEIVDIDGDEVTYCPDEELYFVKNSKSDKLEGKYYNKKGKEVYSFNYTNMLQFSEGLAYIVNDEGHFYIDKNCEKVFDLGEFLADNTYGSFKEGFALVSDSSGKNYILNKDGELKNFENISINSGCSEGLFVASKDGKCGYIDKDGNVVIDFIYDQAQPFVQGLACVRKDKRDGDYGYIDKKGNVVVDFNIFEVKEKFTDKKLAKIEWNNPTGGFTTFYIDRKGNMYEDYQYMEDNRYLAKKNDKWGIIDIDGNVIMDFTYYDVENYLNGRVNVSYLLDGGHEVYGYVDKDGKVIMDVNLERADGFYDEYAVIKRDDGKGQYIVVDKDGNEVLKLDKDIKTFSYFSEGLMYVEYEDCCGFIDITGKMVIKNKKN